MIPKVKEHRIRRKKIERAVNTRRSAGIVIVTGGAGYGKSQAVAALCEEENADVIWYTFTVLDNQLEYFIEQLVKIRETAEARAVLVFDDCHLLKNRGCREEFRKFLTEMHLCRRIFLVSRTEALIQDIREITKQSFCVITQEQLTFSEEEVEEYCSINNRHITCHLRQLIYRETEGWPVAVAMILESMGTGQQMQEAVIYLASELVCNMINTTLIRKCTREEQEFLARLSVAEQVPEQYVLDLYEADCSADLREHVLVHCNRTANVYRFHPLYRSELKKLFLKMEEEERKAVWRRTGDWFLGQGLIAEALEQYRHLDDDELIWAVIQKIPYQRYTVRIGRLVLDMLECFPTGFRNRYPYTRLHGAVAHYILSEYETAREMLDSILEGRGGEAEEEQLTRFYGEVLLFYGFMCIHTGDMRFPQFIAEARRCIPDRSIYFKKGMMAIRNNVPLYLSETEEGSMMKWVTLLDDASADMDMLMDDITAGTSTLAKAQALYYQTDFAAARRNARLALQEGREGHNRDVIGHAYYLLSRIALVKGSLQDAMGCMRALETDLKVYGGTARFIIPEVLKGHFYGVVGDECKVPDWIVGNGRAGVPEIWDNGGMVRLSRARYLLGQEQFYTLIPYAQQMEQEFEGVHHQIGLIYARIYQAVAYYYVQKKDEAVFHMERAWDIAYQNDIYAPFAEQGHYMRTFFLYLKNNGKSRITPEWQEKVLTKSATYAKKTNAVRKEYEALITDRCKEEVLTKKEKEILTKLSIGFSREEIGEYFRISNNTVKSALRGIYTKLGAINGSNAVRIASEKGYIR